MSIRSAAPCADPPPTELVLPMAILHVYAPLIVPDLEQAVSAFARLRPTVPVLRFTHRGLEAALAGGFWLMCGRAGLLGSRAEIHTIAVVTDLQEMQQTLLAAGARIVFGPYRISTGQHLAARLPSGDVVEYLQFGWLRLAAH
ncbi:VOC family protein [Caldimonas brevitalea]|uniref:VOC domain-containing protein n=1 Tax=Caldimonas brevitalea TaxID=413882 RepID=A0A0G3BNB6_9BURK|nr:hypothetical protein [Caldimonas brevitalea]AKJ30892.1 hypothetical protein AAW51_4201 [Caldimonas brevitalea]